MNFSQYAGILTSPNAPKRQKDKCLRKIETSKRYGVWNPIYEMVFDLSHTCSLFSDRTDIALPTTGVSSIYGWCYGIEEVKPRTYKFFLKTSYHDKVFFDTKKEVFNFFELLKEHMENYLKEYVLFLLEEVKKTSQNYPFDKKIIINSGLLIEKFEKHFIFKKKWKPTIKDVDIQIKEIEYYFFFDIRDKRSKKGFFRLLYFPNENPKRIEAYEGYSNYTGSFYSNKRRYKKDWELVIYDKFTDEDSKEINEERYNPFLHQLNNSLPDGYVYLPAYEWNTNTKYNFHRMLKIIHSSGKPFRMKMDVHPFETKEEFVYEQFNVWLSMRGVVNAPVYNHRKKEYYFLTHMRVYKVVRETEKSIWVVPILFKDEE